MNVKPRHHLVHFGFVTLAAGCLLLAFSVGRLGRLFSKLQNGVFQDYLFWTVGAIALVIVWLCRA